MDVRQHTADVVVLGGGPAGAAAAIACAMRRQTVVLLERDSFVRERPGETLHPGVEPLLDQLGIGDRLPGVIGARHDGIWIEWGSPRQFIPFGADASGPWSGFQVWRADFDALLLTRANELGVDVRQPSTVTGLLEGGGVTTDQGPIRARMIIDATGRSRWLSRTLGIDSAARSPRLIARYGYAEGSCPAYDEAPALIGDASGWTWIARVRPRIYQWTRLRLDGAPDGGWVPGDLQGLTAMTPPRGADVTWRLADATAGPGWFMVGDAAATLDPTSSHGVLRALMSGIMAGHLTAAILDGAVPAAQAAASYHAWIADWFKTDAERLTAFYRELGLAGFD